jgi:preprotein translocase subunit SecY
MIVHEGIFFCLHILPSLRSCCEILVGQLLRSNAFMQVADMITELKIGNGTSVLITANIASALPASVGAAVQQAADKDTSALPIYGLAFFLTTLGVVYVQEVTASPHEAHTMAPRSKVYREVALNTALIQT